MLGEAFAEHSALTRAKKLEPCPPLNFDKVRVSDIGSTATIPAYSIKLEAKGTPYSAASSSLIHLYDRDSGRLLALLQGSHLSSVSSALSAALATDLIAPAGSCRLAVIGTGIQGWMVTRFLMEMRNISEVVLFDLIRNRSLRTAARLAKYDKLKVKVADSLSEAVVGAQIIVCATWSKTPFLFSEMVLLGGHITTLGSDEPGKSEIAKELLKESIFFTDDRKLAKSKGALLGLNEAEHLGVCELGELLDGVRKARIGENEISVYAPVGLAVQDLVAAWTVYTQALINGVGQAISC